MTATAPIAPSAPAAIERPKAAHNVFWLVAERGLKAVGGLGIGILIARHLGPENYGRYGAAIGLATLAKEAVMLGFDRMIRRDLAARPQQAGAIIGTSIVLGLVLALGVALALTAAVGHLVDDALTQKLTLIVIWMAFPQAFFACEIWFESAGWTRPLVWTRNVVWLASLAGRITLVFSHASVVAFAILALIEWIVTYAAVCGLLRRLHCHELAFSFDFAQLRAWFSEGRPIILMVVLNSTAERLMVVLVHNLARVETEAGYLSAALRITDIWWSISTIVAAVFLPRIVALQRTDPDRCARAVQLYANASLFVGVAAAVAVTLTAPFLIPWLFGAAYAPSAIVLVIVFWSGAAVFPAVARAQFWVSRGQVALELPCVATVALVQLGLAVLLIPRFGAIGAAVAMTSAQWIGLYGVTLALPRLRTASQAQFAAFRSLLAPLETARALAGFARGMVRKG
ncbi:flippase [Horticoccus sp. 23ND18S-11]|uniref:flippase n=1 Tax=Horticoccus sp. 23ND18S-11 TaxID=3391832 RepID=UPI0039C92181